MVRVWGGLMIAEGNESSPHCNNLSLIRTPSNIVPVYVYNTQYTLLGGGGCLKPNPPEKGFES